MSHIFDALQRSEGERAGVEPDSFSLTRQLLKIANTDAPTPEPAQQVEKIDLSLPGEVRPLAESSNPLDQFESLPVTIAPDGRLVSVTEKDSLAAEKFRFLAVRLRQMQQNRPLKKVLITSTIPEEGKSMIAANLACTLARRQQQKILLVEGDLRRPTVARLLGLNKLPGVTEWLQGPQAAKMNIYRLEALGFWILPAGSAAQNPLELMQSGRLSPMMEQLAAWFDWIVIDSPPVLPLADTSVWARLADGILLVTRQGTTEKQQLRRGIEALEPKKLLGALVNGSGDAARGDYYNRYGVSSDPGKHKSEESRK